ncbi:hypothetical protein LSH36_61g10037 [Paralvinella palmiformis]|uniref:Uncharacterized protein n=1 Tax=Paralvinella palmiformis TaxID=53620 RepID=A0AAD9NDJ2_9ANNE|nr:hypothetical protein LSH36_61g10037 [Paralvinella palmiformis]
MTVIWPIGVDDELYGDDCGFDVVVPFLVITTITNPRRNKMARSKHFDIDRMEYHRTDYDKAGNSTPQPGDLRLTTSHFINEIRVT